MEGDSIFSNALDEFITNDGVKKGKKKGKCIHNKYRCRECCKGFCKHDKDKRLCKEGCSGSMLCKHGKGKYYCKECGGKGICIHNTNKHVCSKCNPGKYKYNPVTKKCEHGKWRNTCNICGYCEHNKRKDRCIECRPNAFCKHEKRKDKCIECNPNLSLPIEERIDRLQELLVLNNTPFMKKKALIDKLEMLEKVKVNN